MRWTQDVSTRTLAAGAAPCLTSEVGDVMMSEHGGRAWVLGQGEAAAGTHTHSTSCRATESKVQSACIRSHGRAQPSPLCQPQPHLSLRSHFLSGP